MGRYAVFAGILASLSMTLIVGCSNNDCPGHAVRQAQLDSTGIHRVMVVAGAGTLRVQGSGPDIRAEGMVCAPDQRTADEAHLLLYIKDNRAVVEARFPFSPDGLKTRMDISVQFPKALPVSVVNKSGDTLIQKVDSVSVANLAGNLRIRNVAGSTTVTRSSNGDVSIEDIGGTAAVQEDVGGSLKIRGVAGNVVLQHTNTTRILVQNVQGDVVIWNDGSGDIEVKNVHGDLFVQADHGGKLVYSGIHGSVHLPTPGGF